MFLVVSWPLDMLYSKTDDFKRERGEALLNWLGGIVMSVLQLTETIIISS